MILVKAFNKQHLIFIYLFIYFCSNKFVVPDGAILFKDIYVYPFRWQWTGTDKILKFHSFKKVTYLAVTISIFSLSSRYPMQCKWETVNHLDNDWIILTQLYKNKGSWNLHIFSRVYVWAIVRSCLMWTLNLTFLPPSVTLDTWHFFYLDGIFATLFGISYQH